MITNSTKTLMLALGGALLFAAAFFIPMDAFAQTTAANDIGTTTKSIGNQMGLMPKIVALCAYIAAGVALFKGIYGLKACIESPEENPPGKPVGYLVAGTLLIIMPYVVELIGNSLGSTGGAAISGPQDKFNAATMGS